MCRWSIYLTGSDVEIRFDLEDSLRRAAELGAELAARKVLEEHTQLTPWLDVERAADYLATTPAAIRSMTKRGQVRFFRSRTGRILFRPEHLDEWARGEEPEG